MNKAISDTKIQRRSSKGAVIRQMGFETSIHALPVDIKQEIDSMLNWKYSPLRILKELSKKYSNQSLPSKSALYNYRKKYFTNTLSNHRQLAYAENLIDEDKIKLKSVLLTQIKRFVAFDLPTLRDKWVTALERDELLQLPGTKDIGKLYTHKFGVRNANLWTRQDLVRTLINSFNSNIEESKLLAYQLEVLKNHLGTNSFAIA